MTELEVITAALGGLSALIVMAGTTAVSRGWVEGSVSLRIIPPRKRHAPEPKAPKAEAVPAAEADGLAKLPECGAA